ncbi:hypothetical protein KSP39_PZI010017 [Platanthera zijinensis]|uniref:MULE transposase domain-containing protein n=1 Tax=Platanthera zijinensis TaxID=2320716 RepID=A0AAP0G6Z0_9ASPA
MLIGDHCPQEENSLSSSSSDSEGMEEASEANESSFSDDLAESEFELDDALYDENIDDEIELVDRRESKTVAAKNVGVSIRESGSHSASKSDKEKSSKIRVFQGDADDSDFEFDVGLCFNSASDFREAVRLYATKQGRPIKFTKNWEHTCYRVANSQQCKAKFLSKKYEHHVRSNPEWPASSMQEVMQMENKTSLSIWKMYRVKQQASKVINGIEMEQYAKLWDYCEEIYRTNPDTTIKIKCRHDVASQTCIFKRLYICWGALKKGFMAGCRPIIGLDGTHIKTTTGGVLLCAVGIDGNNNMFPIAYAYVLRENTKTWEWFVSLLMEDLCIENSHMWTVISDKQKGLIKAIENLLPNAEHQFCVRHMYNNFRQMFRGLQLKDLLWRAASATRIIDFNVELEKLKTCDKKAYDWASLSLPRASLSLARRISLSRALPLPLPPVSRSSLPVPRSSLPVQRSSSGYIASFSFVLHADFSLRVASDFVFAAAHRQLQLLLSPIF